MSGDYEVQDVHKDTWLSLAPAFKDYNYRQAWDFAVACAKRINAVSEHIVVQHPEKGVIALANVRIKKLPLIGGGIAYISGGPLLQKGDISDRETIICAYKALQEEYVVKRKLTLRIAPAVFDQERRTLHEAAFLETGFSNQQQGKKTILLDLSLDLTEIRKQFHQKWRNVLNNVEKKQLQLRTGNDTLLFEQFIPLFKDLISKKAFTVDLGVDFYAKVQDQAANAEKYIVLLAEDHGSPIAGYVGSILGDTCVYLLGAANEEGRKVNAAYLLQWEIIKIAKKTGCRWYDLGGIDAVKNPSVYRFKQRMGGLEVTIPGPYEKKPIGASGALIQMSERVYNLFKNRSSQLYKK